MNDDETEKDFLAPLWFADAVTYGTAAAALFLLAVAVFSTL